MKGPVRNITILIVAILSCSSAFAQKTFADFLNLLKPISLPYAVNDSNIESLHRDHSIVFMTDTLIKHFLSQNGRTQFTFNNNLPHGVWCLGRLKVDKTTLVLYLIESQDTICTYRTVSIFSYDSSGNQISATHLAKVIKCPLSMYCTRGIIDAQKYINIRTDTYYKDSITYEWIGEFVEAEKMKSVNGRFKVIDKD